MSLEVSSRHVRILRTGERGGPRLSFMASELLRWLSALPQSQAQAAHSPLAPWRGGGQRRYQGPIALACPQAMLPGKKVGKSAKHSRVHKRLSTEQLATVLLPPPSRVDAQYQIFPFFLSLFLFFQSALILIQVIVINRMSQTFLTNRISESLPVFVTLWNFGLQ